MRQQCIDEVSTCVHTQYCSQLGKHSISGKPVGTWLFWGSAPVGWDRPLKLTILLLRWIIARNFVVISRVAWFRRVYTDNTLYGRLTAGMWGRLMGLHSSEVLGVWLTALYITVATSLSCFCTSCSNLRILGELWPTASLLLGINSAGFYSRSQLLLLLLRLTSVMYCSLVSDAIQSP